MARGINIGIESIDSFEIDNVLYREYNLYGTNEISWLYREFPYLEEFTIEEYEDTTLYLDNDMFDDRPRLRIRYDWTQIEEVKSRVPHLFL